LFNLHVVKVRLSKLKWSEKRVRVVVFNCFNTISVISWWSVLLVEETGVPGRYGLDSMVVGFITTCAIVAYCH
jgi:hypothetical protein